MKTRHEGKRKGVGGVPKVEEVVQLIQLGYLPFFGCCIKGEWQQPSAKLSKEQLAQSRTNTTCALTAFWAPAYLIRIHDNCLHGFSQTFGVLYAFSSTEYCTISSFSVLSPPKEST